MPTQDREGHVSLWHPWKDKPGQRHTLALWNDYRYLSSTNAIVEAIGKGQYYALCNDILAEKEVSPEIIRDKRTQAFISRTGGCSALQVKYKGKSGFLIPGNNWGEANQPDRQTIEKIQRVFNIFGFEALTPSSLSEKVLRSTLPTKTYISRPCSALRRSLIEHNTGGRIDIKSVSKFYPMAYEYDINKAYLSIAGKGVPSPFHTPLHVNSSSIWQDMPCAWLDVRMTCHATGIQPIQIDDKGSMREPENGETFRKWLWSGEIQDCLSAGYTLDEQFSGWSWEFMSSFLAPWSDILWNKYQEQQEDTEVKDIIKTMMVGLPGRFLRRPEKYTLIHRDDMSQEDIISPDVIPLKANWLDTGDSPSSPWFMKVEQDVQSAQLTPIGSFIVSECRREIYHAALQISKAGGRVLRIYVDSVTTDTDCIMGDIRTGGKRGEYKRKVYKNVRIHHGRFVGYDESGKLKLKATGVPYGSQERERLEREMLSCQQDLPP